LVDSEKARASTAGWGVVGWNRKYLDFAEKYARSQVNLRLLAMWQLEAARSGNKAHKGKTTLIGNLLYA
jgi:hypothetical protein